VCLFASVCVPFCVCVKKGGSVFVYRGERVDLDCKWRLSDYVPRLLTEVRREMHLVFVSCFFLPVFLLE
jgi:hypothetical protein